MIHRHQIVGVNVFFPEFVFVFSRLRDAMHAGILVIPLDHMYPGIIAPDTHTGQRTRNIQAAQRLLKGKRRLVPLRHIVLDRKKPCVRPFMVEYRVTSDFNPVAPAKFGVVDKLDVKPLPHVLEDLLGRQALLQNLTRRLS